MISLKISFKFMKSKIMQTIVLALIITLGMATFYFVLAATDSLNNVVYEKIINESADIIYSGNIPYDIDTLDNFKEDLYSYNDDITDISFYKSIQVSNTKNTRAFIIKGVNFEDSSNFQGLKEALDRGTYKMPKLSTSPDYDFEGIIGRHIAISFFPSLRFSQDFSSVINEIVEFSYNDEIYKLKITGVYNALNERVSISFIFTTDEILMNFLNDNSYNGIDINIENPNNSGRVLNDIDNFIKESFPNVNGNHWKSFNKVIADMLDLENTTITVLQIFISIAIAFSLATIIFLNIRSKYSQLGILKAMGLNNGKTIMIFIIQFLIYTIVGIGFGLLLGQYAINTFERLFINNLSNIEVVLTTKLINKYSVTSSLLIFTILGVANIFPILSIRKLNIIDIIKES